jgi:HPt (histidine-containing phosphotransfer) domain-containing protein
LDIVLKELIRDKQPPEIVEAAQSTQQRDKAVVQPKKDTAELGKYFVIDAEDAVNVLEKIYAKVNALSDTDIVLYTTTVHGIKSALRNINETKLSELAFDLEKAGEERNINLIVDKTPVFIEELKSLIQKFNPQGTSSIPASRVDILYSASAEYLKEKLNELKTACETFDIRAAEAILSEKKKKTWPQETDDAINKISVCLLRSEFKKAVSIMEEMMNTQDIPLGEMDDI